jgi:hydroxymethylpyrimidine pyrophosphatase-like HAD family hydrolase
MTPLIVDIDDTILTAKFDGKAYYDAEPIDDQIAALHILRQRGHRIILHTGRHWDKYEMTVKQLRDLNVMYDQLVMGKPIGIYVDADAVRDLQDLLG